MSKIKELQEEVRKETEANVKAGAEEIEAILNKRGLMMRVRLEWIEGQGPIFHRELMPLNK